MAGSDVREIVPGIWCWQRRPRGLRPGEFGDHVTSHPAPYTDQAAAVYGPVDQRFNTAASAHLPGRYG